MDPMRPIDSLSLTQLLASNTASQAPKAAPGDVSIADYHSPKGLLSRGFDAAFMKAMNLVKECHLKRDQDTFQGDLLSFDEYHSMYDKYMDDPAGLFPDYETHSPLRMDPIPLKPRISRKHPHRRDFSFQSPKLTEFEQNNTVPFKWFSQADNRSDTILLFAPGWGRISQSFEEDWSTQLQSMGVDVGLMTVPYHEERAPEGTRSGEYWISSNLFWTIENFLHFIGEIRVMIRQMRQHYKYVGLVEMSSGGFQTGCVTNVEDVDFYFPIVSGALLGSTVWHGSITTKIKEELEERGIREEEVLKLWSVTDQAFMGHHCRATHIKQYISLHDRVIPPRFQYSLWEALGKPEKLELPCAHYSSYFFGKRIVRDMAAFVTSKKQ